MHWTVGRRRGSEGSPVEAARTTGKAARVAAALGLLAALATTGVGIAAEVVTEDTAEVQSCTAAAITDYNYLYMSGEISHDEFDVLRTDAIQDQIDDNGNC